MSINRFDGTPVNRSQYIEQAISDVLSTPIGSRVMRRDYGSLLPELIDQPQHKATILRAISATATAIIRWVPEVTISRVQYNLDANGLAIITIDRADNTAALVIPLSVKGGV